MVAVHQHGVGDAVGVVTDVVAERVGRFVDGDGDHLEAVFGQFVMEYLPTWQIEKATSPT